jgi:hypothetical protein
MPTYAYLSFLDFEQLFSPVLSIDLLVQLLSRNPCPSHVTPLFVLTARLLTVSLGDMFRNTFQSGFLSILYSIGSKPLQVCGATSH